jgi:uncharacterized membrane protein
MNGHASLALATLAFVGTHFAMSHPLRSSLLARFGERGFSLLYSAVSFATLGWMIWAWRAIDVSEPVYIAPLWWWDVVSPVMLFALLLLFGSFAKHPAFPHPGAEPKPIRPATGAFAITRHPMNWSFAIWALVHISVFGSPRNLIVATGILVLALGGSVGQDRRKAALLGEPWREWQARTSFVPFGALFGGKVKLRALLPMWLPLVLAVPAWIAILYYHAPLVWPISLAFQPMG